MGTLAPSGWRATIWTPPPTMKKAEDGWQLADTTVRISKMWQGLTRGAEVNVGMRQATTDWTQEVAMWITAGPFSHNKGSDRHRRQKESNVFCNGRTATLSKTNNLGLFIGEFGNSHSGATNGLISKLAARSLSLTRDSKKDFSQMSIGTKESLEGPSKRQLRTARRRTINWYGTVMQINMRSTSNIGEGHINIVD
ncbi:unnamed protein product [Caenorhabditis nigoni]